MLYEAVRKAVLDGSLKSKDDYHPFPAYADRKAWTRVSAEVRAYYAGFAHACDRKTLFTPLPAVRYMDFQRDGNRQRYQDLYFPRRSNLTALTIAECIEGKGEYIDDIINGVWAICEESNWLIPACNNGHNKPGDRIHMLPDVEAHEYVDLFAAETGSALAFVYYFLGKEMDKRAPEVTRRIEIEIKRHLLDPYLNDDTHWWMGLVHDNPPNNWNPWINSNMLAIFLLIEPDEERRRAGVLRSALSIQRFLDGYQADGGCDEGPSYFNVAGASVLDYLEEIGLATNGAVDLYAQPLILNMAKYISRVHIAGTYYVNFADAPPRVLTCAGLLERAGVRLKDEGLVAFARYLLDSGNADRPYVGGRNVVYRLLSSIFHHKTCEGAPYAAPRDHYFDGIQVMTARQTADSDAGLYLAAKGGHNAESHNHNDVGNYILYYNGKPVVVDAGVEAYTKFTFNEKRYTIWTMRSDHHNVPVINGCVQEPGKAFAARDVKHAVQGDVSSLTMDIAGAYPAVAQVEAYTRCVRMDRARKCVTVSDAYALGEAKAPVAVNTLCYEKPEVTAGCVSLGQVRLGYDEKAFDASVKTIPLTDDKIQRDWGVGELYLLTLTAKSAAREGACVLTYTTAP